MAEASPAPLFLKGGEAFFHVSLSCHSLLADIFLKHSPIPVEPVRVVPAGFLSPLLRAFLTRISSGEIPRLFAIMSTVCSMAAVTCGTPNPRKGPPIGLFVKTAHALRLVLGMR